MRWADAKKKYFETGACVRCARVEVGRAYRGVLGSLPQEGDLADVVALRDDARHLSFRNVFGFSQLRVHARQSSVFFFTRHASDPQRRTLSCYICSCTLWNSVRARMYVCDRVVNFRNKTQRVRAQHFLRQQRPQQERNCVQSYSSDVAQLSDGHGHYRTKM